MVYKTGSTAEQVAAEYIREHVTKPVVGYVVGISPPPSKTMGHAGAIISGGGGKEKRLTGGGISLILTAECAEVRGEKQKRSANLCVLCGYRYHTHHIF